MITTVLFDCFGVLFDDPLKIWINKNNHDKTGPIATISRALDTGAISYVEYVQQLAAFGNETVERLLHQFQSTTLVAQPMVTLLGLISKTYKTGLLSNAAAEEVHPLLDAHNLRSLFQTIVVSSEVGLAKPDRAIFELALERLGSPAKATVFIDDSPTNIAAARSLGLPSILFEDHQQLKRELRALDVFID